MYARVEREYILRRSDFRRSTTDSSPTLAVFDSFASAFDKWLSTEREARIRTSKTNNSVSETQSDVWAHDCVGLGSFEWVKKVDRGKRLEMRSVIEEEAQPSGQIVVGNTTEMILQFTDVVLGEDARLEYPRSHKFNRSITHAVHYRIYCLRGHSACESTGGAILFRLNRSDMKRFFSEILSWDKPELHLLFAEQYDSLPFEGQEVVEQVLAYQNKQEPSLARYPEFTWELAGIRSNTSVIEENSLFSDLSQESHPFFILQRVSPLGTQLEAPVQDPLGSTFTRYDKPVRPQYGYGSGGMTPEVPTIPARFLPMESRKTMHDLTSHARGI